MILVVDNDDHCIQKFTSDGELITAIGKRGEKVQEFQFPCGIGISSYYQEDLCS